MRRSASASRGRDREPAQGDAIQTLDLSSVTIVHFRRDGRVQSSNHLRARLRGGASATRRRRTYAVRRDALTEPQSGRSRRGCGRADERRGGGRGMAAEYTLRHMRSLKHQYAQIARIVILGWARSIALSKWFV